MGIISHISINYLIWSYMVQYLHFRILDYPLIYPKYGWNIPNI